MHVIEFFPAEHQDDGGDVQARAAGQGARDQEDHRGAVLGGLAEADAEEIVDRDDAVIVIGLDEDDGDEEPGEDGADGELGVGRSCGTRILRREPRGTWLRETSAARMDARTAHQGMLRSPTAKPSIVLSPRPL